MGDNYQAPAQPEGAQPVAAEGAQVVVPDGAAPYGQRESSALVTPTQMRRPWRTVARSTFQALVAFCALFPLLVETTGLRVEDWPWIGVPLAVAAAVTRVMALPQVEVFLRRFLPFLAAAPK